MPPIATLTEAAEHSGHDRISASESPHGTVLVVCDGAGGSSGAAEAAQKVCEHLSALHPPESSVRATFVDWIRWIDRHLAAFGVHGLTTCVVAFVHDGIVEGASVGDSEAWLINEEDYIVLTEHQSRKPLVGSGRCNPVAFGPARFEGTLVLGSDGLFKYCAPDEVVRTVRAGSPAHLPEALLQLVRLHSGHLHDDFSVAVCAQAAPSNEHD